MKNIDQVFNQFNQNTPGFAVAAVKNNTTLFECSVGLANVEKSIPITKATAFRLASLTKTFTAMAIMMLKERGLLTFEDSVRKYLPTLPDFWNNVTIRTLLAHVSGSPDHEKPLSRLLKPGQEPTIYDSLAVLRKRKRLLFKPGSKYKYSDSGYVLLALVIEKVSKQKYATFLLENIFNKINLKNTLVVDETKPKITNRAYGYKKSKESWKLYDYDPLNYIVGDEGIYSTIEDLIVWQKTWNKPLLVSKKTLREALSRQLLTNGQKGRYGFGWFIEKRKGRKIIFQDGFWVGFNNIMLTDLASNTTIIFLSNTTAFPGEESKIKAALTILNMVTKENML